MEQFLETISSNQFILWEEYFQRESFGYEMDNYRFGQMISAIYNVNRSSKSDKIFKPDDFFDFRKESKEQTEDEMVSIAKNLASIFK